MNCEHCVLVRASLSLCVTTVIGVSLNKGHFRTASFVLCEEDVLFGRFKMYWTYEEKIFWGLMLCPL